MNDSLTQNSQQNFNRCHFKCGKKKQQPSHRAYTAKFDAWSHFCKRASSAQGSNTGCFLPGSEDRAPGGSAVTNLDNLKSLMVLLLPQRHVSIFPQCHK